MTVQSMLKALVWTMCVVCRKICNNNGHVQNPYYIYVYNIYYLSPMNITMNLKIINVESYISLYIKET